MRSLGLPFGSATERLAQVSATIDAVRAPDGVDLHTPVLVAAGGPGARALANAKAGIVSIAAELVFADSLVLLRGDNAVMIDELRRRRDQLGVSYILVNAKFMDRLAPPVEALAGTRRAHPLPAVGAGVGVIPEARSSGVGQDHSRPRGHSTGFVAAFHEGPAGPRQGRIPMTAASAPSDSPWAVETRGLTKRFGDTVAVNGVDLRIPRGCAFGYLGPNGAGKTTLIRVLLGLTHADAGEMSLLGHAVPRLGMWHWRE